MTSETRRQTSDDLCARIDAVVTGHETQRSYEPSVIGEATDWTVEWGRGLPPEPRVLTWTISWGPSGPPVDVPEPPSTFQRVLRRLAELGR